MALSRQMLKAMGIEEEKIDQIIESHVEVTNGLKELADSYRERAEKVPELEKKIEELAATESKEDEWKQKYEDEHKAFDAFKAEVEADRAKAEKAGLYRALLREAGIDEKRIESIVKVTDIDALKVEDGQLADRDAQADKVKEEWSDFIVRKRTEGAQVDNPPKEPANDFDGMTLSEKMQYANANPGDPQVKTWLAR